MKKILLNLLFLLSSVVNVSPSQQNSSTQDNVKKANSTSFVKKEKIEVSNKLRLFELQSFDFRLSDFKGQEEINFNFELKKPVDMFQAYFVYIVDENKDLYLTLTKGELLGIEKEKDVTASFNINDLNGLGNDFYIRIGAALSSEFPFEAVAVYIDLPMSNIWNLKFETNQLDFVVALSYDTKYLTITREYLEFLNISHDVYIDTYERFYINDIDCAYQSNDILPGNSATITFYLYDPLHLYFSAFIKEHPKYEDYVGTPCFFGATYDNTMHTLRSNVIFYIDSTTLMSYRLKGDLAYYFRSSNAFYFPINYYETFKDAKCLISFTNYSACGANIEYPLNLHFAPNFPHENYYVSVVESVKDWEKDPEVVEI